MTRTTRLIAKTAARGRKGMAVAHNREGAEIGADVLARGGNAYDAMVAMSFATAVRETAMNSIGGCGVLLAHSAATGTVHEINFYGRTPAGLAEDVFVPYAEASADGGAAMGWDALRDAVNERGALSVGVPTYVAGLAALHESGATMPWSELLQPAIDLAREGFVADEEDVVYAANHLRHLEAGGEIARVLLADGIPMPSGFYQGRGRPVVQPDLARTIDAIARGGADAFYRGPIAEAMARSVQAAGGVLTTDDLARYRPESDPPLLARYRGYEVVASSGMTGVLTLIQMLNLAEQLDLGALPRWSGQCLHLIAEVMRQAWTDRFVYVGDPTGATVPVDALIDPAYAASLVADFPRDHVPDRTRPGNPWPFSALEAPSTSPWAGDPGGHETTHCVTADADGNVVTLTQTLGLAYGSCVMPEGTGVSLYDVTMWMNPRPGTPNSVGPWKTQLGHATPVMLLKDGKPVAALGAPGGRRVVTSMFQTIVNMIDFGMDVQEAIGAPRLHLEGANPSRPVGPSVRTLLIDDRVPTDTLDDLRARGHEVRPVYETGTTNFLAKPLGIAFDHGGLVGGVDVFHKSLGIGV